MKVGNNLTFRAATITKTADLALSKRLTSGDFISVRTNFLKKFENSMLDINLSTVKQNSKRLNAQIEYEGKHVMYSEEGRLEKFFCTPVSFLDRLTEKIDYLEEKMFGKRSRGGRSLRV